MSYDKQITDGRKEKLGRYHHFIWKADRVSNCTTGVVTSAFTNGKVQDWMYPELQRVASPTVLLDSEMCHCGGPTGPGRWTAGCTVQLCSSTGWIPLHNRSSTALLEYTIPIDCTKGGPWVELPVASQIIPQARADDDDKRQIRCGGKRRWRVGSLVEAKFEDAWFLAKIGKRNLNRSYRVHWDGESTCTDEVPAASVRPRRWAVGAEVDCRWYGGWYPAKVVKARSDWSYRVLWDADGTCTHILDHHATRQRSRSEDKGEHKDANPKHADNDSALRSLIKARSALELDNNMAKVEKDRRRIDLGKRIQKMISRKRDMELSKARKSGSKRTRSEVSTADSSNSPPPEKRCR